MDLHAGPSVGAAARSDVRGRADAEVDVDEADAGQLYTLLEEQVIPLFYDRDARGVPMGWLQRMKHALRVTGERFTARRTVQQYVREYYLPASRGDGAGDDPPTG